MKVILNLKNSTLAAGEKTPLDNPLRAALMASQIPFAALTFALNPCKTIMIPVPGKQVAAHFHQLYP